VLTLVEVVLEDELLDLLDLHVRKALEDLYSGYVSTLRDDPLDVELLRLH
jgi:hypothetical protein